MNISTEKGITGAVKKNLSLKWSQRLADLIIAATNKFETTDLFCDFVGLDIESYNKLISGTYNFTLEDLSLIEENMMIDVSEALIGDTLIFQSPAALDIMSGFNPVYDKIFNIKIGLINGGNSVHMSCPELGTWSQHKSLIHVLNSMVRSQEIAADKK